MHAAKLAQLVLKLNLSQNGKCALLSSHATKGNSTSTRQGAMLQDP